MALSENIRNILPKSLLRLWSYLKFLVSNKKDDREKSLLEYVMKRAEKGNAESVLRAMDEYSEETWLMSIGKEKALILENSVQKCNPKLALELGTYCGYSAVCIALKMRAPDSMLLTIEEDPDNCTIARAIIDHAGLSDKVTVVEGTLSERLDGLGEFLAQEDAHYFDFIFMDHSQESYLSDFLLLKERGLLGKGTCIVADDVLGFPTASDFRRYLKSHAEELETEEVTCNTEFIFLLPNSMTVSTYKADLPLFVAT